jgi:sulfatase maturation enzyme AslB (radical SAM superfamily)
LFGLNVEITRNCNLNCKYCYVNKNKQISYSRNLEGILRTIENNNNIVDVTLLGGEPLIKIDDIVKILDKALEINKNRRLKIHLLTNGTIYYNRLKFYKEVLGTVQISVDGYRDVHDRNRKFIGGAPSYDTIIENIWEYYNDGLKVTLNCVVEDVSKWKKQIGKFFKDIPSDIVFAVNIPNHKEKGILNAIKFIVDTIHLTIIENSIKEYNNNFFFNSKVGSTDGLITCKGGTTLLNVSLENDDILPCQVMFEREEKQYYNMGNISHRGIEIYTKAIQKTSELSKPENFKFNKIGCLISSKYTKKFPHKVCFVENKDLTSSFYKIPLRYLLAYIIIRLFRRIRIV